MYAFALLYVHGNVYAYACVYGGRPLAMGVSHQNFAFICDIFAGLSAQISDPFPRFPSLLSVQSL